MSTATEKTTADQIAILNLLLSLRQAHHDKNAGAIAACYQADG